jgi:hypothetical protein
VLWPPEGDNGFISFFGQESAADGATDLCSYQSEGSSTSTAFPLEPITEIRPKSGSDTEVRVY